VIGALRKLLNVLLVSLRHLLRLHLELLLGILEYDDWILCLLSCMMQVRKCLCKKVHRMKMHTMNMLACNVDEHDLL
jgi:hypothetical protein